VIQQVEYNENPKNKMKTQHTTPSRKKMPKNHQKCQTHPQICVKSGAYPFVKFSACKFAILGAWVL